MKKNAYEILLMAIVFSLFLGVILLKSSATSLQLKCYVNSATRNNSALPGIGRMMDRIVHSRLSYIINNHSISSDKNKLSFMAKQEPTITIAEITTPRRTIVYVIDSAADVAGVTQKFMTIIPGELGGFLKKNGLKMASPPLAWYNGNKAPFVFEVGVAVDKPAPTEGRFKIRELAEGNAVVAHFYGPYELTGKAYPMVEAYIKARHKTANGRPNELYLGDPGAQKDPYKVLTDIIFPVK